jgi:hypothetical protein
MAQPREVAALDLRRAQRHHAGQEDEERRQAIRVGRQEPPDEHEGDRYEGKRRACGREDRHPDHDRELEIHVLALRPGDVWEEHA